MFKVNTVSMIQMAHDARSLSITLQSSDADTATKLEAAADTIMSAAIVVLRHEEASVPTDIADSIIFVNEQLEKHDC